jgi:hypothetical protein
MGIFDNLRDSLSKRQAMLGREPNAGNMPQLRPAVMPQTFPNMPNFRMPNLQGIGGIPGLQNIDFSNLPMGMDFSNFDPRAINANPQGFQDMIQQAKAQEQMMLQAPTGQITDMLMRNPDGSPMMGSGSMVMRPVPPDQMQDNMPPPSSPGFGDFTTPGGISAVPTPAAPANQRGNSGNVIPDYMRSSNQMTQQPQMSNLPMPVRNPDKAFTLAQKSLGSGPGIQGNYMPQLGLQNDLPQRAGPQDFERVNPRTSEAPVQQSASLDIFDPVQQAPVQPTAPVQQPLAPYTGGNDPAPYVSNQQRNETGLDALSQQLLFGLDGKGGFIPGAMRAAETSFFNPDGTPRVVEQQVAGLTPDQQRAMEMARGATGIQDQYLDDAQSAFRSSVGELGSGLDRAKQRELESLGVIQSGVGSLGRELSDVENIQRGATGNFGTQLGGLAGRSIGATDEFGNRLGESENLLRGTLGGYDQSLTSQFYNPYEQQVVDQTIEDVFKAGEKQDMAQRARDIQTGGESAFGSRARLSAEERREALGRGLGQSLGSLRAQGFGQAQSTGLNEFARQRAQEMATSQGLSGLAGSRLGSQQNLTNQLSGFAGQQLGAQQGLASNLGALAGTRFGAQQTQAGALSNLGNLEAQMGQQRAQAQQNLGSNLQNIGNQAQQASAFDINQLMGAGQMQQQQQQAQLDATRANQLQAQQAPLAQYQSLLPFMQSVPTGSFQTSTTFAPKPSALQSGLGVGLSTLGALGNFFNQPQGQQQQRSNAGYKI